VSVSARGCVLSHRSRGLGLSNQRKLCPPRYERRPSTHVRSCFLSSKASSNPFRSRQICPRRAPQPTCAPWPQDRASSPAQSALTPLMPARSRRSLIASSSPPAYILGTGASACAPSCRHTRTLPAQHALSTLSRPYDPRDPPILDFAGPHAILAAPHHARPHETWPWQSARVWQVQRSGWKIGCDAGVPNLTRS
jgi:hypothetical protein